MSNAFWYGLAVGAFLAGCNPAGARLDEGKKLATDGKYDDAISVFKEVEASYPGSAEAKLASEATAAAEAARAYAAADAHVTRLKAKRDSAEEALDAAVKATKEAEDAMNAHARADRFGDPNDGPSTRLRDAYWKARDEDEPSAKRAFDEATSEFRAAVDVRNAVPVPK